MGTEEPPRERWIGPKKKGTNDKVQEERERENEGRGRRATLSHIRVKKGSEEREENPRRAGGEGGTGKGVMVATERGSGTMSTGGAGRVKRGAREQALRTAARTSSGAGAV